MTCPRWSQRSKSLCHFAASIALLVYRADARKLSPAAWHGQITPGSDTTQQDEVPFLPYWVPFGSHTVDDDDPSITWSRPQDWRERKSDSYIGGTSHSSTHAGASLGYAFTGSSIEWYGSKSPQHGRASVWIDGKFFTYINCYAEKTYTQQLLFRPVDLVQGSHMIKIVNLGLRDPNSNGTRIDLDAFVVSDLASLDSTLPADDAALPAQLGKRQAPSRMQRRLKQPLTNDNLWTDGQTLLTQVGELGVSAMQFAVVDDKHAIVIDKVEHNLMTVNGHPAWGAVYDFTSHTARPLDLQSNSFCAGGSWLSNGTLINVGGNPVKSDHTGAADFGDVNGLQAVRMFDPCEDDSCGLFEDPQHVRMASARWYSSVARISDGSAFILGGSIKGGWINNETVNNPSLEYYPPKNIHGSNGLPIHSPFLAETLNANLFPIVFHLPDDRIFVAANTKAMIYDWKANTEQRLPDIPNGVRVTYPMTAGAVMLPLSESNGYTPEFLICGGSTLDDTVPSWEIDSQAPASDQCIRMALSVDGISAGWQVESMPEARLMPDLVLLPNGDVMIVNGAKSGAAGYGNVKNQAGQSNADNPAYTPVVYRPSAPPGQRFITSGMPTSEIARLYHSVATLLPSGDVLIAGSNPNLDRTNARYPTEYRVETLSPPYMASLRPSYSLISQNILYGQSFEVKTDIPSTTPLEQISISLMDLGFVTHSIHMNSRLVQLQPLRLTAEGILQVQGPPTSLIYPPGPAWLYILVNGIPSAGKKVQVGDGSGPPVDEAAIQNVLAQTETLKSKHARH